MAKNSPFANPYWAGTKSPTPTYTSGLYANTPAPTPQVQTPPPDPNLIAAQATASRNVALGEGYGAYQKAQVQTDYGLDPAFNNNPYSLAKLLEESHRRSQRGTLNSYASMGQHNSGAYQRAQGENDRNRNIGYYNLARDYSRDLQGIDWRTLQSYASNSLAVDDSTFDSLLRRLRGN